MRLNEIEILRTDDFDPVKTFECGQCFRWEADGGDAYTGVAYGRAARVRYTENRVYITCSQEDYETVWYDYFDFGRDYAGIRQSLGVDEFMREAAAYGAGLRILRQDGWEALCSFIISQCNNIPRIKKIISSLCRNFGDRIVFNGGEYFSFPTACRLAELSEESLAPIRCGYRAAYIIDAARAVASGGIDLTALSRGRPDDARTALMKIRGVGGKVAACVMLFGLHMLDAFPIDVWIKRAIAGHYGPDFDPGIFSPYAGIAQQYIYYYARDGKA